MIILTLLDCNENSIYKAKIFAWGLTPDQHSVKAIIFLSHTASFFLNLLFVSRSFRGFPLTHVQHSLQRPSLDFRGPLPPCQAGPHRPGQEQGARLPRFSSSLSRSFSALPRMGWAPPIGLLPDDLPPHLGHQNAVFSTQQSHHDAEPRPGPSPRATILAPVVPPVEALALSHLSLPAIVLGAVQRTEMKKARFRPSRKKIGKAHKYTKQNKA